MKNLILFSFLIISSKSYSQVNSGQLISANVINSSVSHIGEIKSSILTQNQFQSLYGDCWRLMNGSNIAGSDLANLTQMTTLPDMINQGSSLKQVSSNRVLGSYEADGVAQHSHGIVDPGHRHIEGTSAVNGNLRYGHTSAPLSNRRSESGSTTDFASYTQTVTTGISIQNYGIEENRVKNTGVNFFIKINKECNFN